MGYEHIDVKKDLSSWKKEELDHHHITKTGNKPELLRRVIDHMKQLFVISNECTIDVLATWEKKLRADKLAVWGLGHHRMLNILVAPAMLAQK